MVPGKLDQDRYPRREAPKSASDPASQPSSDSTVVEEFQRIAQAAAQKRPETQAKTIDGLVIDAQTFANPDSIEPETWEAIDRWLTLPSIKNWLEEYIKPGKRTVYGIVTGTESVPTSRGTQTLVKFIDQSGMPTDFLYTNSDISENSPELEALRQEEPEGFKDGDIIVMEQTAARGVSSRKKVKDPGTERQVKLTVLAAMRNQMNERNQQKKF